MTALATGCRLGELLKLKWSDYENVFFILQGKITKSGKKSKVPVRPDALQYFHSIQRKDGYVFPVTRRSSDLFRKIWMEVKRRAGVEEEVRFHDLRHTHVSLLLYAGVDMRTIQELGGWSDLKMLETYAHTKDEIKTEAVQRIPLPSLEEYGSQKKEKIG